MAHKSGRKSYPAAKGHPAKLPGNKTLPLQASATAQARAFGQRGVAKRSTKAKGKGPR